ncbi:MAG TPA: MaoC family dehydratase N-terminal domain-containing protein [Ktedonobacteraceae bacterium]
MQVGDLTSWERTFTIEDVQRFSEISGDQGIHHVQTDGQGRLLVQGLLTATLPTKLGGDMNFIARTMTFEFLRPVFTGDTVRCESTVESVEKQENRTHMVIAFVCRNQNGKEVLTGHVQGIIRA